MLYIDLFYKMLNLANIILIFYKNFNKILKKDFIKFYSKFYSKKYFFFFTFGSSIYSSFLKSINIFILDLDLDFFIIAPFYLKLKTFFDRNIFFKFYFYQKKNHINNYHMLKKINCLKLLLNFEFNQVNIDLQYIKIDNCIFLLKKINSNNNKWEIFIDTINIKKKINSLRSTMKMKKMIPNFFIFKNLINNFKDMLVINKNYKSIFGFVNGITIFIIMCKICRYYPFSYIIFLRYYILKYIFQKNVISFFFLKANTYPIGIKKIFFKKYFKKLTILKCLTPVRDFFLTSYNLSIQQASFFILLYITRLFFILSNFEVENAITTYFLKSYFTFMKISFRITCIIDYNNKKYIKKIKSIIKFFNIFSKFIFHKSFFKSTNTHKKNIIETYNITNNNKNYNKKNFIGQTYFIELQNIPNNKKKLSNSISVNVKIYKWKNIFMKNPKQTLL
uniref:RNA polymerase subunit F n=1 Tax=Lotharella vacuolata TaxID=74820 RepID=A0A0H5BH56_9EUKA|nr:RNA polymerase subunit F [Lotharella vacuolata]